MHERAPGGAAHRFDPAGPRGVSDRASRRYPALEEYRAAHGRGEVYPCNHPIARAACHEANARELYALGDAPSASPVSRRTWLAVADQEMAEAVRILVAAEGRARAVA
jgi:hypothetical protein